MAERFERRYTLPDNLYIEGSPVVISAGALLKDNVTGKMLVQLKIKNISTDIIIAVKVKIKAYEPNGAEVDGVEEYQYVDLNVEHGEEFAEKIPIFLPNISTRRFEVGVTEVVFRGAVPWRSYFKEWNPLEKQKDISCFNDIELQKQFSIEVGNESRNADYIPDETLGLFRCVCGDIMSENINQCLVCGRKKETILKLTDIEFLKSQRDFRLEREKEIAKQKEKELAQQREIQEAKKKKIKKVAIPVSSVLALVLFVVLLFTNIIPQIQYNSAKDLFEQKKYQEAYTAFSKLGSFNNSYEMKQKVMYQVAIDRIKDGKYSDALKIKGDKLSKNQRSKVIKKIEIIAEDCSTDAYGCYDENKYKKAYNGFVKASKIFSVIDKYTCYKQDKISYCNNFSHLALGCHFIKAKKYNGAKKEFKKIDDDSFSEYYKGYLRICDYRLAKKEIKNGHIRQGIKKLKRILTKYSWQTSIGVVGEEDIIKFNKSGTITSSGDEYSDVPDGGKWWFDKKGNVHTLSWDGSPIKWKFFDKMENDDIEVVWESLESKENEIFNGKKTIKETYKVNQALSVIDND